MTMQERRLLTTQERAIKQALERANMAVEDIHEEKRERLVAIKNAKNYMQEYREERAMIDILGGAVKENEFQISRLNRELERRGVNLNK